MTSSEIEHLFSQVTAGDYENEKAWHAVFMLQRDGGRETFDICAAWIRADEPLKRARAADILGQLQPPGGSAEEDRLALIVGLLESESEAFLLSAGITALGHLASSGGTPVILRYLHHAQRDVRFAVAFALGCLPDDARSISGLLMLTRDEAGDVRDWAVFGLGVEGSADSPEIRDALFRCLSDEDEDVREEAAVGLWIRRDMRLLPVLIGMLNAPELKVRVADAAAALLGPGRDPSE